MPIGTLTAGLPTEEITAGTTHSVPYPLTGVNNGDVALLLEVNGAVSNSVISTPPTGFTQVLQNSGTANTAAPSAGIFRHTCNGTEAGTSITVTTTSVTASFILVVLPGAITGAGGIDATAIGDKTTASSALGLSGGITTDTDGCTVVYIASANSTTIAATPMTGFTELADRNTGKSGNRSFEVAYRQNVPTGTLTMSGGTWGGSTKDLVLAVAIKPASVTYPVTGSADASSATSGAVTSTLGVTGSVAGTSAASGAITATHGVTGSVAGTSGGTGTVTATFGVSGTVAAQSTAAGSIASILAVLGTVAGTSGGSGSLTATYAVTGRVNAVSGASGSVAVAVPPRNVTLAWKEHTRGIRVTEHTRSIKATEHKRGIRAVDRS